MYGKTLEIFLDHSLKELEENHLFNDIKRLESGNGAIVTMGGKSYINLSSNNYLGLSTHPALIEAAMAATVKYGVGSGATRTILDIHTDLEKRIAKFTGTEDAIVFQTAFNANTGAIAALVGKKDAILSDAFNHASIIDGCKLSGAEVIVYNHADMADLESKAREATESQRFGKILVISDGVFSMDGDFIDLPEFVRIAKQYGLISYIDDAHGIGVMGKGRGTIPHFGLSQEVDVHMGTLSKGIGVSGGYIAGSAKLVKWLKARARPFSFSNSPTPAVAAASIRAIDLIEADPSRVERLWANADYLKAGLRNLGFDLGLTTTPIIPCMIGDEKLTMAFSKALFENGIYARAVIFPTVAIGSARIRTIPTPEHTTAMLDAVIQGYGKAGKALGII